MCLFTKILCLYICLYEVTLSLCLFVRRLYVLLFVISKGMSRKLGFILIPQQTKPAECIELCMEIGWFSIYKMGNLYMEHLPNPGGRWSGGKYAETTYLRAAGSSPAPPTVWVFWSLIWRTESLDKGLIRVGGDGLVVPS
jgi:hypothetical protein